MALVTHAKIAIAATPDRVFSWLVEPAKLVAWLGAAGGMPEDTSQLHAGWTGSSTMTTPGGGRPYQIHFTDYEPRQRMSMTVTYDGGRSVTRYTLTGTPHGTDLTVDADTDYGAADTSRVDAGLKGQPVAIRLLAKVAMFVMKRKLAHGDFDDTTEASLNSSLEQSLAKLKQLIEAAP